MLIRFRPGGLCPSTYAIDKVYDSIMESDEIIIDSKELLERVMLGIMQGEIPYGNTELSIYDQEGYKHTTKFSNRGQPYNLEVFDVWPLSRKRDTHLQMALADKSKKPIEICGNCSWNSFGICTNDECERADTYVADFEEACESGFSDAHLDHLLELKLTQKVSAGV